MCSLRQNVSTLYNSNIMREHLPASMTLSFETSFGILYRLDWKQNHSALRKPTVTGKGKVTSVLN